MHGHKKQNLKNMHQLPQYFCYFFFVASVYLLCNHTLMKLSHFSWKGKITGTNNEQKPSSLIWSIFMRTFLTTKSCIKAWANVSAGRIHSQLYGSVAVITALLQSRSVKFWLAGSHVICRVGIMAQSGGKGMINWAGRSS